MIERGEWAAMREQVWDRTAKTGLDLTRELDPYFEGKLRPPSCIRADKPAQLGVEAAQRQLGGRCRGVRIRSRPSRA